LEARIVPAAPVAFNDGAYSVHQGQTLTVSVVSGVLTNDTDGDNDPLTAAGIGNPSHGDVVLNSDGSFSYSPDQGYVGADSFTYQAYDGANYSNTATVTIDISNVAPVTFDLALATKPNESLTGIDLIANAGDTDGDEIDITIVAGPSHGQVTQNQNGAWTYTPDTNWSGTDTFTYKANDGAEDSNTSTVTIKVNNDAPAVFTSALTYKTLPNVPLTLNDLIANGSDAEDDELSVVVDSGPSHGTLSTNGNGVYVYTPDNNYTGSDSFTIHLTDGDANSDTVTVSINVTGVPTIIANTVLLQTYMDEEVVFAPALLLANAMSQYSSNLQIYSYAQPSHGVLSVDQQGNFHYLADWAYTGTDSISVTVTDGLNFETFLVNVNVQQTTHVSIDFSNFNQLTQNAWIRMNVGAEGNGGDSIFAVNLVPNANLASLTATGFAAAMEGAGWTVRQNGNVVSVSSRLVNGRRFNVNQLILQQRSLPENRRLIIQTSGVQVQNNPGGDAPP
jgi:VCBS repeat-containing protein